MACDVIMSNEHPQKVLYFHGEEENGLKVENGLWVR